VRSNAVTIPIQALVQRDPVVEKDLADHAGKPSTTLVAAADPSGAPVKPTLQQGVYLLSINRGSIRVRFVPVTTGVTGATDIEVLSGLSPGDEIVTGRYQVLRALKSGTLVKRDNTPPADTDTSSSSS